MTVTQETTSPACSFCIKIDSEVAKLIAGPGVYICDECVSLCCTLIESPPALPPEVTSWEEGLELDEILSNLPRMAAVGAQVERSLARYVLKARERGATWAQIGSSLGMTRQSAWERFSGEE